MSVFVFGIFECEASFERGVSFERGAFAPEPEEPFLLLVPSCKDVDEEDREGFLDDLALLEGVRRSEIHAVLWPDMAISFFEQIFGRDK